MPAAAGVERHVGLVDLVAVPLLLAVAAWTAQRSGLDAFLAQATFDVGRRDFIGADHRWLELVGHQWARLLPIALALAAFGVAGAAAAGVRACVPWRRPALATGLSIVAVSLAIASLKHAVEVKCPYLVDLGAGPDAMLRAQASPIWLALSGEGGDCWPSGHAGAGFTLLALYFAGRMRGSPAFRWGGLAVGVAAGCAFGAVRMAQGKHFLSQPIWSACVAWLVTALVFAAVERVSRRATARP